MKNSRFKNIKNKGFTLIELLVVVAIISLLSSVILAGLNNARYKARDSKVAQDLNQVRTALEMYYNDNQKYPAIAMSEQNNFSYSQNSFLDNNFYPFTKTAEAAVSSHPNTYLCSRFDSLAASLVTGKYLATVPVHPYDDDSKGVCYKAYVSGDRSYITAYGPISQKTSSGINKKVGFVLGKTDTSTLASVYNATSEPKWYGFPSQANGSSPTSILSIADTVLGLTLNSTSSISSGSGPEQLVKYRLTIVNTGSGSGSVSYNYKDYYDPGEMVYLQAYPDPGSQFEYWAGCSGYSDNPCYVTMTEDKTVYASFGVASGYRITVNNYGGGSISLSPYKDFYSPGELVSVTATPDSGYSPWITGCDTSPQFYGDNLICYITVNYDRELWASFNPIW